MIIPYGYITSQDHMISSSVFPKVDFYENFLKIHGITIDEKNPKIIHYFGTKRSELDGMMKDKDMAIIHSNLDRPVDFKTWYPYVVDLVYHESDILTNTTLITNNPTLCQIYYQRLGLNRKIVPVIPPVKPEKPKKPSLIEKIKGFMLWE